MRPDEVMEESRANPYADVTDHIAPGVQIAQATGLPGSVKRRMAEREAARMDALREGLEKRLAPGEWKAPEPPPALRTPSDVSEPDLLEVWEKLQAGRQGGQRRAATGARKEEGVTETVAPPGSAKASIELFLQGKIGLWAAIFGENNWVHVTESGAELEVGERVFQRSGGARDRPLPMGSIGSSNPSVGRSTRIPPDESELPPRGPRRRQRTIVTPRTPPPDPAPSGLLR